MNPNDPVGMKGAPTGSIIDAVIISMPRGMAKPDVYLPIVRRVGKVSRFLSSPNIPGSPVTMFKNLRGLFSNDLSIDLGTANTLIYVLG